MLNITLKKWLLVWCIAIVFMIAIGGITRLTNSGLSITKWQLVAGILPPLTHAQWNSAYNDYRHTPEYEKINFALSLVEFQSIYYMEYIHRLFGRLTFLIFVLPYIYLAATKKLSKKLLFVLGGVILLIAIQGIIGWYMVKSGLVNIPHVSQYRLTIHLILATTIFSILCWQLFTYRDNTYSSTLRKAYAICITITIFVQIALGGLMAGLKAGFTYNTFPLMDHMIIPDKLFALRPLWCNFFENITTVQFLHRCFGILILVLVTILLLSSIINKSMLCCTTILFLVVVIQILLGIFTLIFVVPIPLALLHQVWAFVTLGTSLAVTKKVQ